MNEYGLNFAIFIVALHASNIELTLPKSYVAQFKGRKLFTNDAHPLTALESCLLLCLERHGWDNSAKVLLVDCCKTTIQERDQVAITWESLLSFGSIINLCYVYQVKRLLTVNPVDRITAKEALLHPFFEVHDVEHDRTALRRVKVRFYPHAPWKLLLLCEVLCLVC